MLLLLRSHSQLHRSLPAHPPPSTLVSAANNFCVVRVGEHFSGFILLHLASATKHSLLPKPSVFLYFCDTSFLWFSLQFLHEFRGLSSPLGCLSTFSTLSPKAISLVHCFNVTCVPRTTKLLYPKISSGMPQRHLNSKWPDLNSYYPHGLSPHLQISYTGTQKHGSHFSLPHDMYQIYYHISLVLSLNCFTISFMSLQFIASTQVQATLILHLDHCNTSQLVFSLLFLIL